MKIGLTWLGLSAVALSAAPVKIVLPQETAKLVESPLPGYALAQAMCLTCHSAEYMLYQPPTAPRAYWQATLTKMQKTFGAPLPDEMVPPILEYLVKTYGAERASAAGRAGAPDAPTKKSP
jgi:sulfite dehydrogenase